ncbi:type II secretion system F family protein [Luteolibacter flavescens]|uniref:Type II secretion system F family protein n=1 Tax=Luteolibacter flavescens TaxID=1859460 RepID=A0ABT3FNV5_9BACT|nr:type II secretion system F family protein [Luteolibacter flavescens]MCW1885256.1 type II secretion system F family protein [Luteolibacter flavescens]
MPFSAAQKHLFYTEIAKLLEAGFGIREAGRAMLDTRLPPLQADLLRRMEVDLEAGKSITEAFGPGVVTSLERSLIGAGERGGRMAPAFQHLADYFGMLALARREAIAAMVYPAFLLHMGIFVGVLAPGLMAGKELPEMLVEFVLILLAVYAAVFVLWLGVKAMLRGASTSTGLDRFLRRIPVLGGARRAMAMARFTKVYHTSLLAGLSMRETVETACEASHSAVIRDAGRRLGLVLEGGGFLGPTMISCGAFPSAFARSYATAEESGSLDRDLARWTVVYQEEAAKGTKAAAGFISKGVYFAVLIFIAWTIISTYTGAVLDPIRELDSAE